MAEKFKEHLDAYLLKIFGKISPESIQDFQDEYEELIDEFSKNNFVPKHEVESIIDSSLAESEKQIKELEEQKTSLIKQNTELSDKNKLLSIKNEEVSQKLSVLE